MSAMLGDVAAVRPLLAEARAHLLAVPDPVLSAYVDYGEGAAVGGTGNFARAVECFERVLAVITEDELMRGWSMFLLGWAQMQLGIPQALDRFEKALALSESCDESVVRSQVLFFVGAAQFMTGQFEPAEEALREGLRHSALVKNVMSGALCLEALGWIAEARHHDSRRAVLLLAAASATTRAAGLSPEMWLSKLVALHDQCEQSALQHLGAAQFDAVWSEGCHDLDEAAALALTGTGRRNYGC